MKQQIPNKKDDKNTFPCFLSNSLKRTYLKRVNWIGTVTIAGNIISIKFHAFIERSAIYRQNIQLKIIAQTQVPRFLSHFLAIIHKKIFSTQMPKKENCMKW
ncbi:MAG: hypothetical protein IKS41_06910 [Alphaproteobacteria bacterium]|nr:hypothetical protein [Alphaproteobacteria bacterium]